jgi:hypothetical protein
MRSSRGWLHFSVAHAQPAASDTLHAASREALVKGGTTTEQIASGCFWPDCGQSKSCPTRLPSQSAGAEHLRARTANSLSSRTRGRPGGAHRRGHVRPAGASRAATPEATVPRRERRWGSPTRRASTRRGAIDPKFGSPMVGRISAPTTADSPRVMAKN